MGGVRAYAHEAAEETLMARCLLEHAGRKIQGDHERAAMAAFELGGGAAGTGAQIEDELVPHAGLQHGGSLVGCARAIEGGAHAPLVKLKQIGPAAACRAEARGWAA